jgi:selenocysteine lyase/cysteine desulfurase
MLANQKHLFNLSDEVTYLNCATMSAQLKSVEKIGIENLQKKSNPYLIESRHFFEDRKLLKQRFSKLIGCPTPESVVIIPSVSYGIATAVKNIPFKSGDEIILLQEQFPSNYYAWKALEQSHGVKLKVIKAPELTLGRGKRWNEQILEAINSRTKVVAMPNVHWADGTCFDLKAIRNRTNDVGAFLIIDGTQSIGALPFSVSEIKPDALICAGYKWLMGAYGLGMAYFGEKFYEGVPIENNWINHQGSEDFTNLIHYNENFKPMATRFDMGESSNFIHVPMLSEGIRQLNEWTPAAIQEYCRAISETALSSLSDHGYFIEDSNYRAHHLFGIYSLKAKPIKELKSLLSAANIHVSYRGNAIRVSPNVYNLTNDIEKLVSCFI